MVKYMEKLAKDYPNIVKFLNIGETYEGRSINGVKISTPGENKPIIFIDGAMHAREWLAPPVVLYIIKQLVENVANRVLFADINWYLFPVMNPDGYEYSFKVIFLLSTDNKLLFLFYNYINLFHFHYFRKHYSYFIKLRL